MIDPSSAKARLRPARRHRPHREVGRFVTRSDVQLLILSRVPPGQSAGGRRGRSRAWTLYSRLEWAMATARAERARRRARPPWG
ncbi:hypothetical protein E1293_37015 [Actinomadura darangshiensis]|uniref:Uncharacterized protein n=1 Tax=Actinomadura darangshiensis TaxID=705336 RepID=A0A4R5AC72_9ACTN|nr:hypothetical protein [Actinomadura darangshiensis]TDD68394.1 hypothetical protein E1293_37015 [Actinomadura darangshiensis]